MSNQKQEITKPVVKIEDAAKVQPARVEQAAKAAKPESNLMSQREAVYQEVARVLKEEKVSFDGSSSVKQHLNEARLKKVYEGLAQGFRSKKIALKDNEANQKKLAEPALLQTYIIGLVNNWVRRDPRLNGSPAKQ